MGKCVLEVWGSVLGCGGRRKEVLGEMWGCGKVCWGVGGGVEKCWGRCGENIREVWESVLGCGGGKGEMWGEV